MYCGLVSCRSELFCSILPKTESLLRRVAERNYGMETVNWVSGFSVGVDEGRGRESREEAKRFEDILCNCIVRLKIIYSILLKHTCLERKAFFPAVLHLYDGGYMLLKL